MKVSLFLCVLSETFVFLTILSTDCLRTYTYITSIYLNVRVLYSTMFTVQHVYMYTLQYISGAGTYNERRMS